MGNYMDQTYLAIDGVILTYSGTDKILQIPSKLMDMNIVKLGDGSFMESNMQRVIVPEGIKQIGKSTFSDCPNLSEIELSGSIDEVGSWTFYKLPLLTSISINDFALSKQQFLYLKRSGIPVGSTKFIVTDQSSLAFIQQIINATGVLPARFIPYKISRLFEAYVSDSFSEYTSYNSFVFGVSGGEEHSTEFWNAISDINNQVDRETEEQQDELLRRDKKQIISKTAIIFIDTSNYSISGDTYFVKAEIRFGFYFWRTLLSIHHEGKQYYLYRRNYLSGDNNKKYARVDVAVLTRKGLVRDREEAEEVYAKYRLLSLL